MQEIQLLIMGFRRLLAPSAAALLVSWPMAASADSAHANSLIRKLLAITGLTAAPGQMRSEDVAPGNIWLADVDSGSSRALTADGGYLSPVFAPDGRTVVALRGGVVVAIPRSGGSPRRIKAVNGALKIVGFDAVNSQEIVILLNRVDSPLVSLSLADGALQVLPFDSASPEEQRLLGKIRNQDRVYDGTSIYLGTERKEGLLRPVEWTDIYLARDSAPARNISQCDGLNCAQPALSADGRSIVFIKSVEAP